MYCISCYEILNSQCQNTRFDSNWIIKSTMHRNVFISFIPFIVVVFSFALLRQYFFFSIYFNIVCFLCYFSDSFFIWNFFFIANVQQQLSTLSEGDSEPTEGTTTSDINRISSKGNSSLQVQAGRNEILLGDQSLRQENR